MTRSNYFMLSCILCMALVSCAGTQVRDTKATSDQPSQELAEESVQDEPLLPDVPASSESFDPTTISKAVFDSTKNDVQSLIEEINGIIRDKDFNAWVSYLGDGYRDALSDPAFLKRVSESSVLKKERIVLRNLGDYFMYVVVPSRTKDRVDDIEFIGQNRVKAFTINNKGQKLRLYDLEKTASGWKIAN